MNALLMPHFLPGIAARARRAPMTHVQGRISTRQDLSPPHEVTHRQAQLMRSLSRLPFLAAFLALAACGGRSSAAARAPFSYPVAGMVPATPVMPTPWLRDLEACRIPSLAVDGATWTAIPDMDGDGRTDFLATICGDDRSAASCAMRLCLMDESGVPKNAAAWTGAVPEYLQPFPHDTPPRRLEAFSLHAGTGGLGAACIHARLLRWMDGGYFEANAWRCECTDASGTHPIDCKDLPP